MRAIRPIYDGVEDIGVRTRLDGADILACLFSHQIDEFEKLPLSDEERERISGLVEEEMKSWDSVQYYNTTHIGYYPDDAVACKYTDIEDNLAVLFELVRWLRESGYEWKLTANKWTKYFLYSVGITERVLDESNLLLSTPEYILGVPEKAFAELCAMLPLHWATSIYSWCDGLECGCDCADEEDFPGFIHFGEITINVLKG